MLHLSYCQVACTWNCSSPNRNTCIQTRYISLHTTSLLLCGNKQFICKDDPIDPLFNKLHTCSLQSKFELPSLDKSYFTHCHANFCYCWIQFIIIILLALAQALMSSSAFIFSIIWWIIGIFEQFYSLILCVQDKWKVAISGPFSTCSCLLPSRIHKKVCECEWYWWGCRYLAFPGQVVTTTWHTTKLLNDHLSIIEHTSTNCQPAAVVIWSAIWCKAYFIPEHHCCFLWSCLHFDPDKHWFRYIVLTSYQHITG